MSLNVLVPITATDAAMYQTNVAENDYTAWNSATAYVVGDRVISTTSHKVYECVLAHTNQSPLIAANIGVEWVIVGPTNRWKPFDLTLASAAVKTTGDISYRLLLSGPVDTVAIFGMAGGEVAVELIEAQVIRRNFVTYSEELDNAYWTRVNANLGVNIALDPWGSFQSESMVEDNTSGNHAMTAGNYSFASGVPYTFSAYVRQGVGSRNIALRLPSAAFPGSPNANFDLAAGTAGTATDCTSGIEAAENGWYRVWINATADASVSDFAGQFRMLDGTSDSYLGDNSSSIYITGVQLNIGALSDYQWIRDAATFGTRTFNQQRDIGPGTGGAGTDAIFTGLTGEAGDYLGITVYKTGGVDTQVSEIVFGASYELGDLVQPFTGGVIDFSRKDRDDFGNVTLIRRNFAIRASYTFHIDADQRSRINAFIAYLRSVPVVFYSTTDLTNKYGVAVLGFWQDYELPLTGADVCIGTIEVEGLG